MKISGSILLLAGFFLGPMFGLGSIATLMMVAGVVMLLISFAGTKTAGPSEIPDGYKYGFQSEGTAIAACPERRVLKLTDGKKQREYVFSDVRSWDTNRETGGHFISGGMAALGHNIRTNRENKRNSGLFVHVRDIDNPVWRINMLQEKDQPRWMEILRQTLNDDRPSLQSVSTSSER